MEQYLRDASIADLDDVQFQLLLEGTKVREGADEEAQNKQQLHQQMSGGGGMMPGGAGTPSGI